MAEAAARGAQAQPDIRVRLLPAVEAQPADVLAADGYVFATPETLGAISGLMKDFLDRTEKRKVSPLKAFLTLRPSLMARFAGRTCLGPASHPRQDR